MIQDPIYKNRLTIINSTAVGPKERLNNPSGFHPMVRTSWSGADPLRIVMGQYQTIYQSSKGATFVNYASLIDNIDNGGQPGHWDHAGAPGGRLNPRRVANQLYDIVLSINDTISGQYSPIFKVKGSEAAWNSFENKNNAADGWLESDTIVSYLVGPDYNASNGTFSGLLSGLLNSSTVVSTVLEDYTSTFYSLSSDRAIREASGMALQVMGEYNYYAETVPNYEIVTANPNVSENLLPNAYIMYSELQNTGSILLADYHYSALSIPSAGPTYFQGAAQTSAGVTEKNTVGAYQLWASGLDSPDPDNNTDLDTMAANNTNFVILQSDEAITNSEYITNEMIPYCAVITIPPDQQAITGKKAPSSILLNLANGRDTKSFVDVLQMTAINRSLGLGPGTSAVQDFKTATRTPQSATDSSNFNLSSQATPIAVLCNVNAEFKAYMAENTSYGHPLETAFGYALNTINNYDKSIQDLAALPYRFLKDYGRSAYNPLPAGRIRLEDNSEHIANAEAELSEDLQAWSRTYEEILKGTGCHTETLMYVVSKYLLNDDGTQPATPTQTFYITNKFDYKNLGSNKSIPITFYDSQVKYEKKYRYIFQKIVMIVGNEYYYSEPSTAGHEYLTNSLEKRIKVHNRPNIKLIAVPMLAAGVDCLIVDRPPVPPEMSFYLHRGISNRLQILLGPNTGRYDLPPVSILQSDEAFFEKEYLAQTGDPLSFGEIKDQNKNIEFNSDDPVDAYQLFRLSTPPTSYGSFTNALVADQDLNPTYGTPASYIDNIVPNTKYYYCARAVDIHGNVSNPNTIMEAEVVDNEGKIYLKQKAYAFTSIKQRLIKSGRRFILIEPTLQQTHYDQGNTPSNASQDATPTQPLGGSQLQDSIWNKEFKVRLTSKQTGRKIDLNINFKNSGIVKGSE